MQRVTIQYENGGQTTFLAQKFDIDVQHNVPTFSRPARFSYTGATGEETPLYLTLEQVAGIVVESETSDHPSTP